MEDFHYNADQAVCSNKINSIVYTNASTTLTLYRTFPLSGMNQPPKNWFVGKRKKKIKINGRGKKLCPWAVCVCAPSHGIRQTSRDAWRLCSFIVLRPLIQSSEGLYCLKLWVNDIWRTGVKKTPLCLLQTKVFLLERSKQLTVLSVCELPPSLSLALDRLSLSFTLFFFFFFSSFSDTSWSLPAAVIGQLSFLLGVCLLRSSTGLHCFSPLKWKRKNLSFIGNLRFSTRVEFVF